MISNNDYHATLEAFPLLQNPHVPRAPLVWPH